MSEVDGVGAPRILFLVTEDWYFVSHRLPLAIAACKAGYDVAVATREGKCGSRIRDAGIRLIPFELSRRGKNPLRTILALMALYRREKPSLVHHVAMQPVLFGMLAARLVGVPTQVNAVAGLGWLFTSSGLLALFVRGVVRRILVRLLSSRRSITIVQNPDDAALLIEAGVLKDRLRLIRGAGVDTQLYFPKEEAVMPVVVMLVARMLWDKGVGEFVGAAERLYRDGIQARFVLVGDSDEANPASIPEMTLRAWHGNNGIEWWGRQENMQEVLACAHIACLPSYREGLPKSLLEALACGLPVVTTDAPGCREVVDNGINGILVPVKDTESLAVALKTLVLNTDLRRKMGKAGRAKAMAEFSTEKVGEATMEVYAELLS